MRGTSAEGFALTRDKLESVTGTGEAQVIGDELLTVAATLQSEPALRRALTDPAASSEAKERLARTILAGKVSDDTVEVVAVAATARWSSTGDFVGALEQLGALALAIAAESDGRLDALEDDLFRFARIVAGSPGLRDAITNKQVPVARRQSLVSGLLEGRSTPEAARLAVHALASSHRSFEAALEEYQKIAADRQARLVALVRVAADLTAEERTRLAAMLSRQYGRDIHLNVVVDPEVLGGVRVEIGDEVIDGTVAGRLDDARRRMAG
jgi:F-type H+-transporting ATPase subunit delta